MEPNQKNIRAFAKTLEEVEQSILKKFEEIQAISEKTKKPIPYGKSWSANWKYGFFDCGKDNIDLDFTVPSSCGCCADYTECIRTPWWVWDEPTEENILSWRNSIADGEEAKKLAKEEKIAKDKEESERAQFLKLKEKYKC